MEFPEGRLQRYAFLGSILALVASLQFLSLIFLVLLAWYGERIVNFIPCFARTSSVSVFTAVSPSHIPSGCLPNRDLKSSIPQITWVSRSLALAKGMIIWLKTWASAEPWPENRCWLSLSA